MCRFSLLAACLLLCPGLSAREWTATDGRKLQADFVSATDTTVTLKLANGQTRTLPLARLSEADQAWVHEQPDRHAKPLEGPLAHLITGKWEMTSYKSVEYAIFGAVKLDGAKKYPLVIAHEEALAPVVNERGQAIENVEQTKRWVKTFVSPENYRVRPCIINAADDPQHQESILKMVEALKGRKTFKYTEDPAGLFEIADRVFNDPATHEWLFAQGVKK